MTKTQKSINLKIAEKRVALVRKNYLHDLAQLRARYAVAFNEIIADCAGSDSFDLSDLLNINKEAIYRGN